MAIDRRGWPVPPVFKWLKKLGDVAPAEMARVFNMGIGLVLVVSPYYSDSVRDQLSDLGYANWTIGAVKSGHRDVAWM